MMGEQCCHYLRCIDVETVDLITAGIMILPCNYTLDIIVFSVDDCDPALYTILHWSCIILGTLQFSVTLKSI